MLTLTLCALLQVASPPEGPRVNLVGRCLDADGEPWAGAEVTLVSRQLPFANDAGWQDRVVVTSRDDGRFAARLLEGRFYMAWALQSRAEGAAVRVSVIDDMVLPGRVLELRAHHDNRVARLRLAGTESWKQAGPLGYRVYQGYGEQVVVQPHELVDGELKLPPMAGDGCVVEVLDATGRQVATRYVPLAAGAEAELLPLLPPCRIEVEVRSAVEGELRGLAGARVLLWCSSQWSELGRTDAQGRLTLWRQAEPKGPGPVATRLLVLAEDHAECLVPIPVPRRQTTATEHDRGEDLLRVQVHPDRRACLRGTLRGEDGRPLAGATLVLRTRLTASVVPTDHNSTVYVPRLHRTAADGSFVVPVPPIVAGGARDVLYLALSGRIEEPLCFVPLSEVADMQPLVLDRSRQPPVRIEVRHESGGVPTVLCHLLPSGIGELGFEPPCLPLGPRGRLELRLPPTGLRVVCESERAYIEGTLPDLSATTGPRALSLTLRDGIPVRGRLLFVDGAPVPGATLTWQATATRIGVAQRVQPPLYYRGLRLHRVRVAVDGSFCLWLPDKGGYAISMQQSYEGGGRIAPSIKRLVVGDEPPEECEIRIKR